MAKFLVTTGISHYLEKIITNANDKLIMISPYLKINDRLRQYLQDKNLLKIDIRLVYGKNELQPAENAWLESQRSIQLSFCRNVHAKCYLNEKEAIITSMNLHEFSQQNNEEMGIYVNKAEDPELYADIYQEAMRLVRVSDEAKVPVVTAPKVTAKPAKASANDLGFCIRCHAAIPLNPVAPYCRKCYKSWEKFENSQYEEKHCHICGRPNNSTRIKPSCYECYKTMKDTLEFPAQ
jgi:hypothetical protein